MAIIQPFLYKNKVFLFDLVLTLLLNSLKIHIGNVNFFPKEIARLRELNVCMYVSPHGDVMVSFKSLNLIVKFLVLSINAKKI